MTTFLAGLALKTISSLVKGLIAATLAAAYAENREFDKAREWQEKAIALAKDDKEATDTNRESLRSRLELYKTNKPYREPLKAK